MRIILASESAFRRRAMDLLRLPYEIHPSSIDEKSIRSHSPEELTQQLAEAKGWKVAAEYADAVIVSGDAVVAKAGKIFEKPRDLAEAAQFLRELSGNQFQFITALAVIHSATRRILSAVETSEITFRALVEREIQEYIGQYSVLNYAGAFESDAVLRFADRISGSYNFVTALPVSRLIVFLRAQGVEI